MTIKKTNWCGEVPATKLAALQKVLQSEFLNAVREVYEHVYETVDVQGNPEIRYTKLAVLFTRNSNSGENWCGGEAKIMVLESFP